MTPQSLNVLFLTHLTIDNDRHWMKVEGQNLTLKVDSVTNRDSLLQLVFLH